MTVAVGDLHLDALNAFVPDAEDRVLRTLGKAFDFARREGSRDVVLLGDVFDDAYPSQNTVANLIGFLTAHRDLTIHVIMGNHDHDDTRHHSLQTLHLMFRHKFLRGRVYLKPRVVQLHDGEQYFFCPHPYVTDQPKQTRYAFGHFGYEGARGDNGFVIRNGANPRGRWVLGDYHTYQRGKNYVYPGSLCQVKFHENADKNICHITDKVRAVAIAPEVRLGRMTITSEADLAALTSDTFWSVNVRRGVKLPENWLVEFPQVVRHHTEKNASKRQRVLMAKVASEDPLEGLAEDLTANQGLSDPEVARAYELLNQKRAA